MRMKPTKRVVNGLNNGGLFVWDEYENMIIVRRSNWVDGQEFAHGTAYMIEHFDGEETHLIQTSRDLESCIQLMCSYEDDFRKWLWLYTAPPLE